MLYPTNRLFEFKNDLTVLTMEMADRQSITLRFLRPAQVDGCGNANTSQIPIGDGSVRRLPGGLATPNVTTVLPRVVLHHTEHRPRSLPKRVVFVTGAGGSDAPAAALDAVDPHALPELELRDTRPAAVERLASLHG